MSPTASPPQAPAVNTYTFESAYQRPPNLAYTTPPLDSPREFSRLSLASPSWPTEEHLVPSPSGSQPPCRSQGQWRTGSADPRTPPLLDMSLLTDTSSLDDSISTDPSLPVTPLFGQQNIRTQTPKSEGRLLRGLGIDGLFESYGNPFGGLGLLSDRFEGLGIKREVETGEDGVKDREDDVGLSKTFLREVLLSFCPGRTLPRTDADVFSTSRSTAASVAAFTLLSNVNTSDARQSTRDASVSTISSQLKCLPKKLKAGKVAQKGRRVGPTWKL